MGAGEVDMSSDNLMTSHSTAVGCVSVNCLQPCLQCVMSSQCRLYKECSYFTGCVVVTALYKIINSYACTYMEVGCGGTRTNPFAQMLHHVHVQGHPHTHPHPHPPTHTPTHTHTHRHTHPPTPTPTPTHTHTFHLQWPEREGR